MSTHTDDPRLPIAPRTGLRRFHQARWDEPIVFQLSVPGSRGVLVPGIDEGITAAVGDATELLPPALRRADPPGLPELSQPQVVRHYLRLSQENLGADLNIDVGQGTCTMKYAPKVNDLLVSDPKVYDMHPRQHVADAQGLLEIIWRLERMLAQVSGMDAVSVQPTAGSSAIWTNVAMIRAYHAARGEAEQRDEVITTIFSHPSNAACAKTAGYKVITLFPDADGYPDLDALRAALSDRTAALLITNPEDTGIYNPRIKEFVDAVHAVGGLACYDQANANGILGVTRARDAGFDLCHFNLHKTFGAPHGCGGPGAGASCVSAELAPFLPGPLVRRLPGGSFDFDSDRPQSIGKVAPFYGVVPTLVRAYAWIRSLGAEGLREVAEQAALNSNYLQAKVLAIAGATRGYPETGGRIEQTRYSWEPLSAETGISSEQIGVRAADWGVHYWTSHHPYVVPEPFTLEPTESYSRAELDEYAAILAHIAEEARTDPEVVRTAPHRQTVHHIGHADLDDPERWVTSWRAYRRKYPEAFQQ